MLKTDWRLNAQHGALPGLSLPKVNFLHCMGVVESRSIPVNKSDPFAGIKMRLLHTEVNK